MPLSLQQSVLQLVGNSLDQGMMIRDLLAIPKGLIVDEESSNFILIQLGFFHIFLNLLNRGEFEEICLLTIGRHFLYSDKDLPVHLDFEILIKCASSDDEGIASAALWLIGNMPCKILPLLHSDGLLHVLSVARETGSARCKFEAFLIIKVIITHGSINVVRVYVDLGWIDLMIEMLSTERRDLIKLVVGPLAKLFRLGELDLRDSYYARFSSCGGWDVMADLMESCVDGIGELAAAFHREFCRGE
jgi:hypothetical protein